MFMKVISGICIYSEPLLNLAKTLTHLYRNNNFIINRTEHKISNIIMLIQQSIWFIIVQD